MMGVPGSPNDLTRDLNEILMDTGIGSSFLDEDYIREKLKKSGGTWMQVTRGITYPDSIESIAFWANLEKKIEIDNQKEEKLRLLRKS